MENFTELRSVSVHVRVLVSALILNNNNIIIKPLYGAEHYSRRN